MQIKDIYEVDRDDYTSFLSSIKKDCSITEFDYDSNGEPCAKHIFSKDKIRHFASCVNDREKVKYYIIDLPLAEESQPVKGVLKIELTTPEQVQTFFDILNKARRENND